MHGITTGSYKSLFSFEFENKCYKCSQLYEEQNYKRTVLNQITFKMIIKFF